MRDDTGREVTLPATVGRAVSIVPSLTEALAATGPDLLVGATSWCAHPPELDVARVRGTKNPDVEAIVALRPDLVIANFEENREVDLERLRAAGIDVWVTAPRTVPEALTSLSRMLGTCGLDEPGWLETARAAWEPTFGGVAVRHRAVIPIWRKPWMVVGSGTFTGDVLARLGVANVFADATERYPKVPLHQLRSSGADLVVLPDEPYPFSTTDGPGFFGELPAALVSGRHLEWYGPSLVEAPEVLQRQLFGAR